MLVEPRPPHRTDAVAWLQQRPHSRARAATHEAKMPAVLARQELDDGAGLAMSPHTQHDAFVGPFHGVSVAQFARKISAPRSSFRGDSKLRNDDNKNALNQPWASPV